MRFLCGGVYPEPAFVTDMDTLPHSGPALRPAEAAAIRADTDDQSVASRSAKTSRATKVALSARGKPA